MMVRSAAKVNLSLDVLSRRSDGYHELQSVVHTVGLWDTLRFEPSGSDVTLRCSDARLEAENNLCVRAVGAFRAAHDEFFRGKTDWQGLHISLDKNIPTGAGLGGGSGNAAATLLFLNHAAKHPLPDEELEQVALNLGADVPLFLRGGCVLMEGIGERLTPLPTLRGWLVIAQPTQTLSTPQVFRAWDEMGAASERGTPAMLRAMEFGARSDLTDVASALQNDLGRAAQNCGVDVDDLRARLMKLGAIGASMTGSGSSVFGIFQEEKQAHQAAKMWHNNHRRGENERVWVAPFFERGVELSWE